MRASLFFAGRQAAACGFFLSLAFAGFSPAPAQPEEEAAEAEAAAGAPVIEDTVHHRVLWMKNPSREAVLSWTTYFEGSDHRVHYDVVSREGRVEEYANEAATFSDGRFTMVRDDWQWSPNPGFYHHVHLGDLEPDTFYYVVFASDDKVSEEFHFRTAPADDKEMAVLFGGDSRIGGADPYEHTDRQKMNLRMASLFEANPRIYALVHGGDYCQLAEWRYLEPWLSDHEMTTTAQGRLLPIIPARGNHDRAIGFEEMFTWPDLGRDYYFATDLGPEISLLTLNTEISLGGDQRDWLAMTLEEKRPKHRWVFVQYHRPAYSSVRGVQDGAGRRNNWVPYFEQFNVDLVCESHDHALKRTLPIRAGAPDPENGIIYIGDGGLGVPQRTPDPSRWWLQEPGFATSAHHVHVFEFGKEELHVRAYGMDGEILDDFIVTARQVAVGD